MSDDVAIVGIGMHPFGRHDGVTGMEQGAVAIRNACADAGVEWGDLQFAFGGSTRQVRRYDRISNGPDWIAVY